MYRLSRMNAYREVGQRQTHNFAGDMRNATLTEKVLRITSPWLCLRCAYAVLEEVHASCRSTIACSRRVGVKTDERRRPTNAS